MSYFGEEKLKNDFEKPKFDQYDPGSTYRERGGCLTLFLVVIIAANVFFMFSYCAQLSEMGRYSNSSSLMPFLALAFALQCAVIACAVAIWNWKKWGFYGLAAAYVLQIVILLFAGTIPTMIGSIIGLVILVSLVNPKLDMFE